MASQWLLCTLVLITLYGDFGLAAVKFKTTVDGPRILVISLDGFGHNYLTGYKFQQLEHLSRIFSKGSTTVKFRNQFVTKTFPNHFSIGTGLYEEVHGVVSNAMFDPIRKTVLEIDDEGFFTQNPGVYPIWSLNEAQGGHSGCIMWPGCGVEYQGQNVTFLSPYKPQAELQESISLAMQWFTDAETPANLVFVYHEQPDFSGHVYGPDSPYVLDQLKKIDEAMNFLVRLIALNSMQDDLDIIILSDHGMSSIPESNIIDLNKIVDSSLYNISGGSPVLNVWVTPEHQLDVYSKLLEGSKTNHYKIYLKENIPEEWHYKNNNRVSRILLVSDDGYVFQDFRNIIDHYKESNIPNMTDIHGDHGFPVNDSSMEPIFFALGPSFKHKFVAPSFSNLDVYPLLCYMLSLPPGPNNGTLENISTILSEPISSALLQPLIIALGCLVGLMALIGIVACSLSRRDSRRRVSADSLINGYVHRKTMRGVAAAEGEAFEEEGLLDNEIVTVNFSNDEF